jgi:hypothetical protein
MNVVVQDEQLMYFSTANTFGNFGYKSLTFLGWIRGVLTMEDFQ